MINQQLLDYVRQQKTAGISKEAIIQALAAGGWTANDVNEAFMAIEGVKVPPPPPPPPPPLPAPITPPAPPVQPIPPLQSKGSRVIVPPPGSRPPGNPNAAPVPSIGARPMIASSEFSTAPGVVKKRRGILKWLLVLLILILLGLGALGVLAYLRPGLVASYIPAVWMFFPQTESAPATSGGEPAPTTTTLDTSTNASITSSTTIPQ